MFSIGNLCVYKECRRVFEEMDIRTVIEPFTNLATTGDNQVVKYAARIIQKLNIDNG